jgi:hypothetical protein
MISTWQLKEVGSQSSLSGQTKVDESQDPARGESGELHTNTHGRAEQMICSPKHKFSPLWMRSFLAAKEKKGGRLKTDEPRPFVRGTTVRCLMGMPPREELWHGHCC